MPQKKKLIPDITAGVGKCFDVSLYCSSGTGFVWALDSMPDCVALLSVRTESAQPDLSGAPYKTVFTFLAQNVCSSHLSFILIRPWEAERHAESKTYALIIREDAPCEKDIASSIGPDKFLELTSQHTYAFPVMPYGFPEDGSHIVPLYGFPANENGCQSVGVIESRDNCVLKYGTPWGIAKDFDNCTLKYGFPVNPLSGVSIGEDSTNCVVKYGTPDGVAEDPFLCKFKYGFPAPVKYGFPACK